MDDRARLEQHWPALRGVVARAQRSSRYCSIASIDPDGLPTVTPIGTVFLRDDGTGYYFDTYTCALARNLDRDPRLCLMAVDTGLGFWLRSLASARFDALPGVRLYGRAGPLRPATGAEIEAVRRRVRMTRWLRGSRRLWSDFTHVRDLEFTAFRPVAYPVMMAAHLPAAE